MKKEKKLKTLGLKFTLLFVVLALVLCLGICVFSGYLSWREYTDFFWEQALASAKLAASYVDGDRIAGYLETREKDAYYFELEKTLQAIKREQNIKYLYIFVPDTDHFTYVMDVALETDDTLMFSEMGDTFEYTELEYQYLVQDVAAKRACQQKVMALSMDSIYGLGVSSWAPVFNSQGDLVAMVEADMDLSVVVDALKGFLIATALLCCALVLAVVVALAFITRRMVSKPIARLTKNVRDFATEQGLTYPMEQIQTGDELQTLSEAFGKMAQDIDQYTQNLAAVAADKERIATELSLATDIQISLLPRDFPAFPGREEFDVYAMMQPAKVVGGDFYDFFLIDHKRLGIVVGGVSGRGIPAALFMVVAKTIIKNQLMTGMPVEEAMNTINARLYESSTSNMTVTAFVGVLDTTTGGFSYVNAGQGAPLLMRKDSGYEFLVGQEMSVLAEVEHVSYRRMEAQLRQGDYLVLYSEGVPSAKNLQGQQYGLERLRNQLNANRGKQKDLKTLVTTMCDEITAFEDGAQRDDDVTVLALTYQKGDKARAEVAVRAREGSFGAVQKFLRAQLEENALGGAFYARICVAVEETFALAASRCGGRGDIIVRCVVADGEEKQKQVVISLLYGGPQANPLESLNETQQDGMAFVKKSVDDVRYAYQEGKNTIILLKRV